MSKFKKITDLVKKSPDKVYHGSHNKIDELIPREVKNYNSIGSWFTSDPNIAKEYYGPNVASFEKPSGNFLEADTEDFHKFFASNLPLVEKHFGKKSVKIINKGGNDAEKLQKQILLNPKYMQDFRKMLEDAGYNGIVWKNSKIDGPPRPHDVYLNFHDKPIKALEESTSLPMDEASRMARAKEMGFDTDKVYYHATKNNFEEFNPSKGGLQGSGVYLGSTPERAEGFLYDPKFTSANTIPIHIKQGKMFKGDLTFENVADQAGISIEEARKKFQSAKSPNDVLKDLGFIGRSAFNDAETVIFDPKNIRSKFAEFDPSKADSANLSAFAPKSAPNLMTQNPIDLLTRGARKLDQVTGQPIRAAALAALEGKNPLDAAKEAFNSEKETEGRQIARKFLEKSEEAGMPLRAPGSDKFMLEEPLGLAADVALDPTTLPLPAAKFGRITNLLRKSIK